MIIVLLIIAGILKALKDRLDNPYTKSVFPIRGTFWNRGTGKQYLGYYFDAWHIADALYILCFCFIATILADKAWWVALLYFTITQISFNIFYSLFKSKQA